MQESDLNKKELLIQKICELDETANPRFLEIRSEKDLEEYYYCLVEREQTKVAVSSKSR